MMHFAISGFLNNCVIYSSSLRKCKNIHTHSDANQDTAYVVEIDTRFRKSVGSWVSVELSMAC